jgi:hypothetical protein
MRKKIFIAFMALIVPALYCIAAAPRVSAPSKKPLNHSITLQPGEKFNDNDGTLVENTGEKPITVWYYSKGQKVLYLRVDVEKKNSVCRVQGMTKDDEIKVTGEETTVNVETSTDGDINIYDKTDIVLKDGDNTTITCGDGCNGSTISGTGDNVEVDLNGHNVTIKNFSGTNLYVHQ